MFNPKDIEKIQAQLKRLGIDQATLERAARSLMDIAQLRKVFSEQSVQKDCEGRVDRLYEEVQEIFNNHEEHPDGCEKGSNSG